MTRRIQTMLALSMLAVAAGCNGPLPFMSGGALHADEERPAPMKWSFDEDFAIAQLETAPDAPYSVNIAYTQIDGRLYIHAGDTRTTWVEHMEENPAVRLRVGDVLYVAEAERVTDPTEITRFARVWTDQSMFHRDPDELEEVWLYRLGPP